MNFAKFLKTPILQNIGRHFREKNLQNFATKNFIVLVQLESCFFIENQLLHMSFFLRIASNF